MHLVKGIRFTGRAYEIQRQFFLQSQYSPRALEKALLEAAQEADQRLFVT